MTTHDLIKRADLASVDDQHRMDGVSFLGLVCVAWGLAVIDKEALYPPQLRGIDVMAFDGMDCPEAHHPFVEVCLAKATLPFLKVLYRTPTHIFRLPNIPRLLESLALCHIHAIKAKVAKSVFMGCFGRIWAFPLNLVAFHVGRTIPIGSLRCQP